MTEIHYYQNLPDGIELYAKDNGDVDIYVYNLKRFTVEHNADGFECAIWDDGGPFGSIQTYEDDDLDD